MGSGRSFGPWMGALLLIQLIGLTLPFILITPIVTSDFLISAAPISGRIRIALFLLTANALLTIWIGIKISTALDRRSGPAMVWLSVLGTAWLVLQFVDNAHILSMLSLSEQSHGSFDQAVTTTAATLKSTRRYIHYSELFLFNLWFTAFYGILFAFRLIPRPISIFGLLAVCVHAGAVTLPVLIGYPSIQPLGVSLALSHIAVAVWLITKGFSPGALSPKTLA